VNPFQHLEDPLASASGAGLPMAQDRQAGGPFARGVGEETRVNKPYNPIKSNDECEKIIKGTFQGVLCMADANEPYAVPMNHAYQDGRFIFHCAATGRKLEIIDRNPSVTYVITKYYGDQHKLAESLKCHGFWESVIAYGRAKVVSDREEIATTFRTFMAYYGHEGYQHEDGPTQKTKAIVIEVDRMTARREYDEYRTDYWYWERRP
jgi:uncharacterized protein